MADWTIRRAGRVHDVMERKDLVVLVARDEVPEFGAMEVAEPNAAPPLRVLDKGRILTALSKWWCDRFRNVAPLAFIDCHPEGLDDFFRMRILEGRCTLMVKLCMLPIRAIVRKTATGAKFVARTKAEAGKPEIELSFDEAVDYVWRNHFTNPDGFVREMKQCSLRLFKKAQKHCEKRGLMLTDTEFKFGALGNERLMLGGELLTPDTARFEVVDRSAGVGSSEEMTEGLRDWYLLIYRMITGKVFS